VPAVFWGALIAVALTLIGVNLFLTGEKKIEKPIPVLHGVSDPQFLRSMGSLLGPALLGGNRTSELLNGDQIFPAMLDAIGSARDSISFETYIYWSGEIGKQFTEALAERARAGVKVHLLLDWVGSGRIDASYLSDMSDAGVEIERYHPLRWYNLGRLNNRTHRKLLVVDGRVGFTGGVGIADKWMGHGDDPDHWRDSHFRIEGPVVAQVQAAFLDNWMKTRGEVLHGDRYFPALVAQGDHQAQMFTSSPGGGSESVRLMYLLSIAAAEREVWIANAYFVPDNLSRDTLVAARRRGVEINVMVPGPYNDVQLTRKASRALWGPLLEAGVRIHEYQPTMYHCKVMVVDDLWVSVGSTNFDNRSFRLNDEANLNIYDGAFAARQTAILRTDREACREVTLDGWRRRPLRERVTDRLATLLRSQL
jgi:cardiolipin synthase A/B